MSKVRIGGCLGHTDNKVIKFKISVDRKKSASKTPALDMRRADFRLLRELVSKVPWENIFAGAGVHHCWSHFKHHLLRAQEQAILKYWESRMGGRRPVWLSRDLLLEIR